MTQSIPTISFAYARTGRDQKANELGMRPMQERAYEKRGEQYLLIKSPPASGKSRALMFIALDKLHNQGMKQTIVAVPERTIGASFNDEPLSNFGFHADWKIEPRWNLCNAPDADDGRVKSVGAFLKSGDRVLLCTHATFRFAVERFGAEAFDDRLIAIDEFHHVSANPENRLGVHLGALMARDKVHVVAMTGSYFRGDAEAVLTPDDEARFETVTYTYYEQLNGYKYLKRLDIGYFFYTGAYTDDIPAVLNPGEKTIVHIPSVQAKESTKDKYKEADNIIDALGEWRERDEKTGFQLVKASDGRVLRVANLVDDDPAKRNRVLNALRDPSHKDNRDHVDIVIALGMAKEGFDWIWCEHALTVGYRASLTEIVQIIGRTTRDAKDKTRARFTNLIAEPDASSEDVTEAVNDTLKAIAASLLMEQVIAPRFDFTPKTPASGPIEGVDYGPEGYDPKKCNIGHSEETGAIQVEIKGLTEPKTEEAKKACQNDIGDIVADLLQDTPTVEKGVFTPVDDLVVQEITMAKAGKIVREKYPHFGESDQEAIRERAVATLNLMQKAGAEIRHAQQSPEQQDSTRRDSEQLAANTALIDGVRKYAMDVRELDIDLIDGINPFGEAYAVLARSMSEERLKGIAAIIAGKKAKLTHEEARGLAMRAIRFREERGRNPSATASDPWERRMAEGVAFLRRKASRARDD